MTKKATPSEANIVGIAEAAIRLRALYGLKAEKATLYKWRERHADTFPTPPQIPDGAGEPVPLTVSGAEAFRFDEIVEWCRETGRLT